MTVDEAELCATGFRAANPYFECLIAEEDGEPAGFALFFLRLFHVAGTRLHLEDLFVRPRFRGRGIGKALLTQVRPLAVERGCVQLFWHVLDWNQPAIEFYRSLGADTLDGVDAHARGDAATRSRRRAGSGTMSQGRA